MKYCSVELEGREIACLLTKWGHIPIRCLNQQLGFNWPEDLLGIISAGKLAEIQEWYSQAQRNDPAGLPDLALKEGQIECAPPYRNPGKIWGIGLNYQEHAADLEEQVPTGEPASFLKPGTTIIGPGDQVQIPALSERTTGEAELGLIIGKKCRNVPREDWKSALAGFVLILDMTAEDILERNPRNLTQAKSFDTFFSFGPIFYTLEEAPDLFQLQVRTVLNGEVIAQNLVKNMTFPLDHLVSYHSQIMTLLPGDILATGTPGAARLKQGDIIECQIGNYQPLINPVIDLKMP